MRAPSIHGTYRQFAAVQEYLQLSEGQLKRLAPTRYSSF
jgi:hypothetical protein